MTSDPVLVERRPPAALVTLNRPEKYNALDLNLLRVFEALVEERSVTRAGARLGLTQSAISHALNRLRYVLKDELFVRGPDGMQPTERAAEIAPRLRQGLLQLQLALAPTEFIPETEIEMALRSPLGMISSDGAGLANGTGHPRSVGTFARTLGRYVREQKVLSLMEALRKMTLLPAQRLEKSVPRMKQKGRLQVGRDADIVIFNPATVRERATYKDPHLPSEGIEFVIVNGTLVLDRGKIVEGVAPGQWLRHPAP